MNFELMQQLFLLRCAVANVIDQNPNVNHITMNEILQWIDDIREEMKK
jgi:hypothetical protein